MRNSPIIESQASRTPLTVANGGLTQLKAQSLRFLREREDTIITKIRENKERGALNISGTELKNLDRELEELDRELMDVRGEIRSVRGEKKTDTEEEREIRARIARTKEKKRKAEEGLARILSNNIEATTTIDQKVAQEKKETQTLLEETPKEKLIKGYEDRLAELEIELNSIGRMRILKKRNLAKEIKEIKNSLRTLRNTNIILN